MKRKGMSFALPLRFPKKKGKRIFEVDFLRGVAIFLMVIIHACYSLGYGIDGFFVLPKDCPEWIKQSQGFFKFIFFAITQPDGAKSMVFSPYGYNLNTNLFCLEAFFAGAFMFLSGISCSFSQSNAKRAIGLAYVSALMTILFETLSAFMGINFHIWLGILHSLAFALIVYSIFDHFFQEWWQHLLFVLPLTAINFFTMLKAYPNNKMLILNPYAAKNVFDWFSNVSGLLVGRFRYGDDYFPPFLITLVVFLGGIVGKTLYKNKKSLLPEDFPTAWAKPIIFIGKHTLIIYLSHQVIIYIILALVLLPMGARIRGF